jgi:hypothetical protein
MGFNWAFKSLYKAKKFISVVYGGRTSGINCPLPTNGDSKTSNILRTIKDEELIL